MVNKLYLFGLMCILLFIPANALIESDYNFNLNQDADIKVACFDTDNSLCTNATSCYLSLIHI